MGYIGNGPCTDQDGKLYEEQEIPGGVETHYREKEGSHSGQERSKYVVSSESKFSFNFFLKLLNNCLGNHVNQPFTQSVIVLRLCSWYL